MTRAEAKRFACYLLACDMTTTALEAELVSSRLAGEDERRVNDALHELRDELLRRAGTDEWSGDPMPEDIGIKNWTPVAAS